MIVEDPIMLWLLSFFMFSLVILLVYNWWVAEKDEKRWRRKLQEEQHAARIRQYRYGDRVKDKQW